MTHSSDAMADKMVANLLEKTGKTLPQWLVLVKDCGLDKHMQIIKHLKTEHGVTHGYANLIAHHALKPRAQPGDADLIDKQYAGAKQGLRPIYEAVIAVALKLGKDVELAPKKTYVSLRAKKQFAILQPSTKDRLDLGLNLKDHDGAERLELAGSFNAMVSHRIRITQKSDINAELKKWLKLAYEAAK